MTKRLQAIEDRARALGWTCATADGTWYVLQEPNLGHLLDSTDGFQFWFNGAHDNGLLRAERLLALYEPGVEVTIGSCKIDAQCCELEVDPGACGLAGKCPGPGTYKLVLVEVPDAP